MRIGVVPSLRISETGIVKPEKSADAKIISQKSSSPREKVNLTGRAEKTEAAGQKQLERINAQARETEVKKRLLAGMLLENDKLQPSPKAKAQIQADLALYPTGCLKLIKDHGVKIAVLGKDQLVMDSGLLPLFDHGKYREEKNLGAVREKAGSFMDKHREAFQGLENLGKREAEDQVDLLLVELMRSISPKDLEFWAAYHSPRHGYYVNGGFRQADSLKKALIPHANRMMTFQNQGEYDEWMEAVERLTPDQESGYSLLPTYNYCGPEGRRKPYAIKEAMLINGWDGFLGEGGSAMGQYMKSGRTVILKEGRLNYGEGPTSKVPVHEMGHALLDAMREKDPEAYERFDRLAEKKYRECENNPAQAISDYALANPGEFQAEGINAYLESPRELKALDKEWYAAVKDFVALAARLGEGKGEENR